MKALRELLLLLGVAALPAGLAIAFHPELANRARAGLPADAIRPVEAAAWDEPPLWIDTRESAAFAAGHIPGAIRFDETAFSASLGTVMENWRPGRRLVVYCDSSACARSREIARHLREAGLDEVYYLHGGWEAWSAATSSS